MKRSLSVLAATAALCAAGGASAQVVLTTSSWVPPGHAITLAQKEWCDLVTKNSKNSIRCNHLPRAVAAPQGTLDAVKNGLADVSFIVHGYTPGRFIATQMAEMPFLGDSAEAISVAFDKVASKHKAFDDAHDGVHVLAYFTHGPGIVFNTKRPVNTVEDLQGLKWRVGGGLINDVAKVLNMNVTLKPATESYELLSGGVMDGTLFPAESIEAFKLDKLIKHATVFPGGLYNTSFAFIMDQDAYNKLNAAQKKVVDAASGEVAARMMGRSWDKFDRRAYGLMQANNVKVTKASPQLVSAVKSRVASVEKKWAEEARSKGLQDPAKVLAEFRAEVAKQAK